MITNAEWISTPIDIGEICPIFSKKIKAEKTVTKAEISISATGVYEARINEKRSSCIGCTVIRKTLK